MKNGFLDLIAHDPVFENESTNHIKMDHIKTMLYGNLIGIDKLERLILLQSNPLISEFDISIKKLETVSRSQAGKIIRTVSPIQNYRLLR